MKKVLVMVTLLVTLVGVLSLFSSNVTAAPRCLAEKPNKAPDLFQIDTTRTSATVYFTPVNNAVTDYRVVYGYARGSDDFGVSFPSGYYDGVLSFTVNHLAPNTRYYFRVIALNGCRYGYWSDTLSARTNWDFKSFYRVD